MTPQRRDLFFQILVTLAVTLIVVLADVAYFGLRYGALFPRHVNALTESLAVFLLFSFAFPPRGLQLCAAFALAATFLQMIVVSYFGSFIQPIQILLAFTQWHEILETASAMLNSLLLPGAVIAAAAGLVAWLFYRFPYRGRQIPGLRWLVLIALVYSPLRTWVNGNTYGKQPAVNTLAYSNFYGSLSYLVGHILPSKSAHAATTAAVAIEKPYVLWAHPQHHVVFVIGESLRYQNMQLFGYSRATTPLLAERLQRGELSVRKAVAGAVSTDVSVPLLMNNLPESTPLLSIHGQDRCLFRLAHENGFGSVFISAQGQLDLKYITNYLCPNQIDHFKTRDNEQNLEGEALLLDDLLLKELEQLPLEHPQFIVLHQRGSHSPYEKRYPPAFARFTDANVADPRINSYDNSVLYTDFILDGVIRTLEQKSKLPVVLVFTSDHGEALGENGAWGHVILVQQALEVPFLFWQSPQRTSPGLQDLKNDVAA